MEKLNEEAAPNNNLPPIAIETSKEMVGKKNSHEFSEELSDGRERDQYIQAKQREKNQ